MTNGIIIIHKEQDYTSADVVALLRGMFGQRKIGHTGTLDPNATGVLPVCLGSATKLCDMLTDQTKEYHATLELGKESDTQDVWGTVTQKDPSLWQHLTKEEICAAAATFQGVYDQLPPMYSAVKIGGKRLYELARAGKEVERKTRSVTIYEIEVLSVNLPNVELRVRCSKGTYIRTLIADLGEKLGCGAVMSALIRTSSGGFDLSQAYTLEQVQEMKDTGRLLETVLPVDSCFMEYPAIKVKEAYMDRLYNGNYLFERMVSGMNGEKFRYEAYPESVTEFRIYDIHGTFCGIYFWDAAHENLHVRKMFLPM